MNIENVATHYPTPMTSPERSCGFGVLTARKCTDAQDMGCQNLSALLPDKTLLNLASQDGAYLRSKPAWASLGQL